MIDGIVIWNCLESFSPSS